VGSTINGQDVYLFLGSTLSNKELKSKKYNYKKISFIDGKTRSFYKYIAVIQELRRIRIWGMDYRYDVSL
jgi:hypothetical protein